MILKPDDVTKWHAEDVERVRILREALEKIGFVAIEKFYKDTCSHALEATK
jgi:hypothetical protein